MMLGQQPSEYTEYGTTETGYADYSEGGYNEFKANGKPSKRARQAGRRHDLEASALGAALEAERSEIVRAMRKMQALTGARAVVNAYCQATV